DYHTLTSNPVTPLHVTHGIDRAGQPHYIDCMTNETTPSTIDLELTRLEEQVTGLLETVERLSKENRSLRAQQDTIASERANLLEKHDQVRNRVDAIVTRLKSMETGA
ncbi:MAG: TIGR02449 family protein, partial [Gammaproteobacteria bacterium]